LFTEFALTLAGAVLISGFVALTLSPMMCARLLKLHHVTDGSSDRGAVKLFHKLDYFLEKFLEKTDEGYRFFWKKP